MCSTPYVQRRVVGCESNCAGANDSVAYISYDIVIHWYLSTGFFV